MALSWGTCLLLPLDLNLDGDLYHQLSWVSSFLCSWVSQSLIVNLFTHTRAHTSIPYILGDRVTGIYFSGPCMDFASLF